MASRSFPSSRIPKLCRHKARRLGYITWLGREHYLGAWPDDCPEAPESVQLAYQAFLAERLAGIPAKGDCPQRLTVAELCASFLEELQRVKGRRDFLWFRASVRPLVRFMGALEAEAVGPKKFKEFRNYLIQTPLKEATENTPAVPRTMAGVNKVLNRTRRIWSWAVEQEFLPASCLAGIKTVAGVRQAKRQILPVPDEDVRKTLDHLPPVLAAMVRLQRLTAMRPGELCGLTMAQIDRSDKACWWYHPAKHKNAWRGRGRAVPLGIEAQKILLPFFRADPDRPLFSPADRVAQWREAQRAKRKTKVQPSQISRSKMAPKRQPGEAYTTASYGRAIAQACDKAGVTRWAPNQLRKAASDEILNRLDLDHARALLGHADAEITIRDYAVRDRAKARAAANQIQGV